MLTESLAHPVDGNWEELKNEPMCLKSPGNDDTAFVIYNGISEIPKAIKFRIDSEECANCFSFKNAVENNKSKDYSDEKQNLSIFMLNNYVDKDFIVSNENCGIENMNLTDPGIYMFEFSSNGNNHFFAIETSGNKCNTKSSIESVESSFLKAFPITCEAGVIKYTNSNVLKVHTYTDKLQKLTRQPYAEINIQKPFLQINDSYSVPLTDYIVQGCQDNSPEFDAVKFYFRHENLCHVKVGEEIVLLYLNGIVWGNLVSVQDVKQFENDVLRLDGEEISQSYSYPTRIKESGWTAAIIYARTIFEDTKFQNVQGPVKLFSRSKELILNHRSEKLLAIRNDKRQLYFFASTKHTAEISTISYNYALEMNNNGTYAGFLFTSRRIKKHTLTVNY